MQSNGTAAKMSDPIGRTLDAALRPTQQKARAGSMLCDIVCSPSKRVGLDDGRRSPRRPFARRANQ